MSASSSVVSPLREKKRANSDVFFSTKHTHKHINTRNISRNNDNALVKGEKI